jgi:crotonobetainyl-CoA:carnitine CoA-transferase CaiB-like acyl-CoA transferase
LTYPLSDIRVLALEQFGAGPWATLQLADLGAEVIKIEDPTVGGDVARYMPPYQETSNSVYFESFNRNKRSVSLDLRHTEGRAVFEDLVRHSDAVFSNLRGDGPAALRITYQDLAAVNPRIVCVSLSGFGSTGPRATERAYDATIQALAGWMSLTGGPDDPPIKSGLSLVDFSAGYVAALGLTAGVWQARRDGRGRDVDLSLFETSLSLLNYVGAWAATHQWTPQRVPDSGHQTIVPFQAFKAQDGYVVVACAKESLWVRFCSAIDRPDLADDPRFATFALRHRNADELRVILGAELARRTVDQWIERFANSGVPAAPVNDVQGALADEQTTAREMLVEYQHPVLGEVRTIASPYRLHREGLAARAPMLGEHTDHILSEICGYPAGKLEELRRSGAFGVVEEN